MKPDLFGHYFLQNFYKAEHFYSGYYYCLKANKFVTFEENLLT